MIGTESLLRRLDAIGESISKKETALALIGLGSVGVELDRLDQYSDLDFFVIVKAGSKQQYLDHLDWLTDIAPLAYTFPNTEDGYKLLFEDGIFCEFAVFEEAELKQVAFSPGRVVWKAEGFDEALAMPGPAGNPAQPRPTDWLIGEAITNIYVGLLRDQRGERLSAMRFIQGYAVDRILELAERVETATHAHQDMFSPERRYELRHPGMAQHLPGFLQGYGRNRESALAALSFLDEHFDINEAMKEAVLRLSRNDLEAK